MSEKIESTARALLDRCGTTYAAEAGIRLRNTPQPLYQLLVLTQLLSARIRADIAAGEVTYSELFAVQPFDNQVVRLEMTGDQVYRVLEQQFQTDNNGNPRTRILQVSGRLSFEIVQKAAVAGIPIVSAVSAPSSLAVEAGDRFAMTLVGFVREGRLNVYTHPERVAS
jgi:2',3'-cyclic-nucleotide 2'-phosphodiesterase (5'-nucleotidase family)